MQADAQVKGPTQLFLFHREKSTSTNTRIHFFSFTCAYDYVCAGTSESEIALRQSTNTRLAYLTWCVWPLKTMDPDYLAH